MRTLCALGTAAVIAALGMLDFRDESPPKPQHPSSPPASTAEIVITDGDHAPRHFGWVGDQLERAARDERRIEAGAVQHTDPAPECGPNGCRPAPSAQSPATTSASRCEGGSCSRTASPPRPPGLVGRIFRR